MSTTDDINHIGNEWTCDKKLSEVDVRSNKWHETYQNVHFSFFRQLVGLAVGRWFIYFFAHGARFSRHFFFHSEAVKKTFSHRLWWVGRETRNKTIFLGHRIALPCCGYSLESHCRCVFNEYPQRVLWRNKINYALIITKYPPLLMGRSGNRKQYYFFRP